MRNYSAGDIQSGVMDVGKVGPCMLPGHPQEHHLELRCWSAMRSYLYNHTFEDFIKQVKKK